MTLRRTLLALLLVAGGTACGDDDAGADIPPAPADIAAAADFTVFRAAAMVLAGDAAECVAGVIDAEMDPGQSMYDLIADEPDLAICGTDPISDSGTVVGEEELADPWVREYTVRADALALAIRHLMNGATPPTAGSIPDVECIGGGIRELSDADLLELNTRLSTPPFGEGLDAAYLAIAEGCGWIEVE
ncbi:MAG: hypothetical protein HZA58_02380 [Acidimicrobiia bacterium]|nr:hypothetical protein [Acidimicrobiia bacterium]